MRLSLRNATTRLILAHFLLVAASTAALLGYVLWSTTRLIDAEVREVIQAELRGLADDYSDLGALGLARAIEQRARERAGRDSIYLLATANGLRIAGNLARWPEDAPPGEGWVEIELYRLDRDEITPVTAAALLLPRGERLLVGRDAQARQSFESTLLRALVSALAVTAALALATGWLLSRFVRRRVDRIAATARGVGEGDFAQRAPVLGGGDEFDRLSLVLNDMLERIDALVSELRMVTDSMAHDLRSPLTRLRAHLVACAEDDLDEATRRARIDRAEGEADRLLTAFTELIAISRAEAGVGRDQFAELDLARLAADAAELYEPTAEEKGLTLALDAEAQVPARGHRQLLSQALSNLVENAMKHTPAGGTVTISARRDGDMLELAVRDDGPGVPPDQRDAVLKRFTQLDPSRGGGGAGLGLALVAAVAKMHGGAIELADNTPGLRASLRIPGLTG